MAGRYFDFTPPAPWAGLGLADNGGLGIGDALLARRDRQNRERHLTTEEARQAAAQRFMEQQATEAAAGARRREAQDAIRNAQADARQRFADTQAIGKALGAGSPGLAQGLGAASQYPNPRTGKLEGIGVAQKPNPALGPAPPEPQQPAFVGPLETPEGARTRAMGRGLGAPGATEPPPFAPPTPEQTQAGDAAAAEVTGEQAGRDKYGTDVANQTAYRKLEGEHAEREKNPLYTLTYPGGQSVDVDPREQKNAQQQEARDTAARLRQAASAPGQAPDVAATMLRQADLIESQVSNADKAPITNMGSAVQAQDAKASESALERTSREKVASGHDAARLKAKAMGKGLGAKGPDFKGNTALERSLENFKRSVQWNKLVPADRSLKAAMANLSGTGPDQQIKHKDAQIQMARYFRGTTPTEGEMALLYNNLGGKLGNGFQAFVEKMATGDLTPAEIRPLQESIKTAQAEHGEALRNAQEAARTYFASDPTWRNAGPSVNAKLKGIFQSVGIDLGNVMGGEEQKQAERSADEQAGATRVVNGKTYRKVGPNNWQPVSP